MLLAKPLDGVHIAPYGEVLDASGRQGGWGFQEEQEHSGDLQQGLCNRQC